MLQINWSLIIVVVTSTLFITKAKYQVRSRAANAMEEKAQFSNEAMSPSQRYAHNQKFADFEVNVRKSLVDLRKKVFLDHINRRKLRKNRKKLIRKNR